MLKVKINYLNRSGKKVRVEVKISETQSVNGKKGVGKKGRSGKEKEI